MSEHDQVLKLLGFANRARKLTLGMTATCSALRKHRLHLLILATDLSRGSEATLRSEIGKTGIRTLQFGTKELFGSCLGRTGVGIIGVTDSEFAKGIYSSTIGS